MPTVTYTQPNGTQQTLQVEEGTTLMRAAVSNGIDGIIGECGGQAMCATCHVYVRPEYAEALPEISDDEDEMLDPSALLSVMDTLMDLTHGVGIDPQSGSLM